MVIGGHHQRAYVFEPDLQGVNRVGNVEYSHATSSCHVCVVSRHRDRVGRCTEIDIRDVDRINYSVSGKLLAEGENDGDKETVEDSSKVRSSCEIRRVHKVSAYSADAKRKSLGATGQE